MNFVLYGQSKSVRRDSDSRLLEIDEKGENCSFQETDNTNGLQNSIYANTTLRQSKNVRRDSDRKILEIDEKGDNCSYQETDHTNCLQNNIYTNTALRQLPVYNDNVASALGVKYSSYVSRSGFSMERKNLSQTGLGDYNIFEDPLDIEQLPHPSKLFGKSKAKEKRKREKPNSVECHISQLQRKRAKMNEQIEKFKAASGHVETVSSSSLSVSGHEDLHNVSGNQEVRDLSWYEEFLSTKPKKRPEKKLKRHSEE